MRENRVRNASYLELGYSKFPVSARVDVHRKFRIPEISIFVNKFGRNFEFNGNSGEKTV